MSTSSATRDPGAGREDPLVSVIVPTFNRGRFLERCLTSVLGQSYRNLECLVVDGGSTDQTLDLLRTLSTGDPRLRFVSEPDEGEVDATNKGMVLARGQIMGVLASDDCYEPDAVRHAVAFLLAHPEFIGVSGDALYMDEHGRDLHRGVITYRGRMASDTIRRMLIRSYMMCPVYHAAFFGWRERILAIGRLDPAFSVMPDFDFYLRLLEAGTRIATLRRVQVRYTLHAEMGAVKHRARVETQRRALHARYGLRWYHEVLRLTWGRLASYAANPYRAPFRASLGPDLKEWWARLRAGFFDARR